MLRRPHSSVTLALLLAGAGLACGPDSRKTSFRDQAGNSCTLECVAGESECPFRCAQAPKIQCMEGQKADWVLADLVYPATSGRTVQMLCPACDGIFRSAECSPVGCEEMADCPYAGYGCSDGRCQR